MTDNMLPPTRDLGGCLCGCTSAHTHTHTYTFEPVHYNIVGVICIKLFEKKIYLISLDVYFMILI